MTSSGISTGLPAALGCGTRFDLEKQAEHWSKYTTQRVAPPGYDVFEGSRENSAHLEFPDAQTSFIVICSPIV
jgi:hypothetical protein